MTAAAARLAPGKPATDTTAIEHLDWQVPCDVTWRISGMPCGEPAAWLVESRCPDCARVVRCYRCDPCFRDPEIKCRGCKGDTPVRIVSAVRL